MVNPPHAPKCQRCNQVPVVSFDQCRTCKDWYCPDCGMECDCRCDADWTLPNMKRGEAQ